MLTESLLNRAFWLKDSINGGSIRSHCQEIERLLNAPEELKLKQQKDLGSLIEFATRSVRFYRSFDRDTCITDLPVIPKALIRSNNEEFLSLEANKRTTRLEKTSGSYGTPMYFPLDKNKRDRRLAEVLYFNNLAGYRVGMRFVRLVFQYYERKLLRRKLLKNEIEINVSNTTPQCYGRAIDSIITSRPSFILGWPSVTKGCADYILQHDIKMRGIAGIVTYGEILLNEHRETISKAFNCPVFNRYACSEMGVLAHSWLGQQGLRANEASYVIEILDMHKDSPAQPGRTGRVVVTDLFSRALPLIRYETGDTAAARSTGEGLFLEVEGRQIETIFDADGGQVEPMDLLCFVSLNYEYLMNQFQLAQVGSCEYEIRVVPGPKFAHDEDLARDVQRKLGADAVVRVRRVSEIPARPSGKRVLIANEVGAQG